MDLDPEGHVMLLLLGSPGFPAYRTQQNQPENVTPDRSCKGKADALRGRDENDSVDWATSDFSSHHWGER